MKLLCHSSINSTHLAGINVLKNKILWVLFSPPSLNPPPKKKTLNPYLKIEKVQSCHSQTLFVLWGWPVWLSLHLYTHLPQQFIQLLERTLTHVHNERYPTADYPLSPAGPRKCLWKKNNQYIHVFPSSTLWYRMSCITCTKKSISLPPS